jgi:hypothetical protein
MERSSKDKYLTCTTTTPRALSLKEKIKKAYTRSNCHFLKKVEAKYPLTQFAISVAVSLLSKISTLLGRKREN